MEKILFENISQFGQFQSVHRFEKYLSGKARLDVTVQEHKFYYVILDQFRQPKDELKCFCATTVL